MDINELEKYRKSDAVKFHKELNPRLWDNEDLQNEVRLRLLDMADDFREFLGVDNLQVKDITVSGSNAAYNYTPTSDIDLHLVVDVPKLKDEVYRELFNAKKYQYNDQHDYRIGDHEVELYVQPSDDEHHSQGIYSVQDSKWVRVPSRKAPKIDDVSVKNKYNDLGRRIEKAVSRRDLTDIETLYDKIVNMRSAGLETTGEFGVENLVFKLLRKKGLIDQLRNTKNDISDKELSITEKRKKKKKTKYGKFNGAFFPGYGYYGDVGSSIDTGSSDGGESVRESQEKLDVKTVISEFVRFCCKQLELDHCPKIKLKRDPQWSQVHKTFGKYDPDADVMHISIANRHPVDVMRTIAHELVHHKQDETAPMPDDAGATGSKWENEANAGAGVIMRNFAQTYPEYFTLEESTGFIPTDSKLAHDPRYIMGLTGDIKPGETQRQAAKLGMKIDKSGSPPLLHKSAAKNTTANKAMNLGLTENWARTGVNKVLYQKAYQVAYDILNKIWTRKQAEQGVPKHALEYYASQIARQFPENIIDARTLADMVANQQLDEIWGFAAGNRVPAWKRGKIKKKKEKFEPSAYDKLVARRQAAAKGDKEAFRKSFKDIANNPEIAEGYRLQLERGSDMDVLHITDTKTGKRTEVRGKPDYETNYDADDKLHQLLDRIGKASNISDLINGEPVGINPRHPDGASAKKHTDIAFGEDDQQTRDMRRLLVTPEHPLGKYLYHLTGADGLLGMLRDGHLGEPDEYFSMTADPKYDVGGGSGWTQVNIIIDSAKVKKLETFEKHMENWEWGDHGSGDWAKQPGQDWESEYRVEEAIPLSAVVAVKILKSAATPEIIKLAKQRNIKLIGKDTSVQENLFNEAKQIKTKKNPDGFTIDLIVDGKHVGQYTHAREDDIVRNQAEIFPEYRNKGYGTMLLLAAIKTADDLGLDFEEDTQSLTPAMSRLYDELSDSGMIYGGSGAWAISPSGESELEDFLDENFADGKKKGKSRPGRVKRSGASCNGSVTDLRARAKKYGGEKGKMYQWCLNMKSGKKK